MQNIFSLCSFCGTAIFYLVIIMNNLVKKLIKNHSLSQAEYEQLIKNRNPEIAEILQNVQSDCVNRYTETRCSFVDSLKFPIIAKMVAIIVE